jgi:hypothetical protein
MSKCEKINNMKNELKAIIGKTPIDKAKIIDFLNKYKIKFTENQFTRIRNECDSGTTQSSLNYIGNSEECRKTIADACKSLFPNGDKNTIQECKWGFAPGFSNIKQSNIADSTSKCYISSISKEFVPNNDEAFAFAVKTAIANLPDMDCSKIDTKINVDSYYNELNRCADVALMKQKNIIESCGGVSDVVQSNYAKTITECIIGSGKPVDKPADKPADKPIDKPTDDNSFISMLIKNKLLFGGIGSLVVILIIVMIYLLI